MPDRATNRLALREVSADEQRAPCLGDEEIVELAGLGMRISSTLLKPAVMRAR